MRSLVLMAALLWAVPSAAQTHFGYAGVLCGLESEGQDFATEVAPFTNIAHVCPTGDIGTDAMRLSRAWELGMTPLFHVEPFFFSGNQRRRTYDLWTAGQRSIALSGVPPEEIILYVADEPSLRRFRPSDIYGVLTRIRADLPAIRTMIIDGYRGPRHPPLISSSLDYWGFNMYLLRDPAEDTAFMDYLQDVQNLTPSGVELVLVMDATHTPTHAEAGLNPEDMADVARNYAALAAETENVAMLLAYAWPSGIEWEDELGARDLPQIVRDAHEQIGRAITGR